MSDRPHVLGLDTSNHNFKLTACAIFALSNWNTQEPSLAPMKAVLQYLRNNVARVKFLMLFPAYAAMFGADTQLWKSQAESDVLGATEFTSIESIDMPANVLARFVELSQAQAKEQQQRYRTPEWDQAARRQVLTGQALIDRMATAAVMGNTMNGYLSALVTSSWTAFEAVSGDLWQIALNMHPQTLAALSGKPKLGKGDDESLMSEKSEYRSVRLDVMQEFDFDIKGSMGSLLRGKFDFGRLSGIRRAYTAAFSKNSTWIEQVLRAESIDALCIVRNLIVHKGGTIDREYLRRAQKVKSLPSGEIGATLRLDGEIVVGLISPVFQRAEELIRAVDDWLVKHPQTA